MAKTPESAPHNSSAETGANGWDTLREQRESILDEQARIAPEEIVNFYKQAREAEWDFSKRSAELKESGEEMSQKEFEKWEDAVSDELGYAQREMENCISDQQSNIQITDAMILPGAIEIQAGQYFRQRKDALMQAIQTANSASAEQDMEEVKNFYPTVGNYLELRFIPKNETLDRFNSLEEYAREREYAHNQVIKSLNGLNSLAKQYHTRPLTSRNFLPSDTVPERMKHIPSEMVDNLHAHDREIVENYCFAAFRDKVEELELRREIRDRLMR